VGVIIFAVTFFNNFNGLRANYRKRYVNIGASFTGEQTMKTLQFGLIAFFTLLMSACVSDRHSYNQQPQKIYDAVNAKYANDKSTLVFVNAPEGFVAPRLANCAVEKYVDNGKVAAIVSALALKNSNVVVAGENDSLTATTLTKALTSGKEKINGSRATMVSSVVSSNDAKNSALHKTLLEAASASGVALEFIDNPK
jgi:hypothetical protein